MAVGHFNGTGLEKLEDFPRVPLRAIHATDAREVRPGTVGPRSPFVVPTMALLASKRRRARLWPVGWIQRMIATGGVHANNLPPLIVQFSSDNGVGKHIVGRKRRRGAGHCGCKRRRIFK